MEVTNELIKYLTNNMIFYEINLDIRQKKSEVA